MPVRTSSSPTPAPRFAGRRARQATPLDPAPPAHAEFPLSFGQERLWFFDQLVPRSDVYNIPVALHLRGALDASVNLAQNICNSLRIHIRKHSDKNDLAFLEGESHHCLSVCCGPCKSDTCATGTLR